METTPSALRRIILILALLPVLAFCIFGFLATFEPLPENTQWIWRSIYGIIGVGSLLGMIRLFIPRLRK